jgi:hypothetical protein
VQGLDAREGGEAAEARPLNANAGVLASMRETRRPQKPIFEVGDVDRRAKKRRNESFVAFRRRLTEVRSTP